MSVRRVPVDPRADDIEGLWARAGYEKRPLNWHLYDPDAFRFHSGSPLPIEVGTVGRKVIALPRLEPKQSRQPRRPPQQ